MVDADVVVIRYVAEHQQKLNSVHVFLGIDGRDGTLGEDDKSDRAGGVEAEVVVISNSDFGTGTGTEANLLVRIPSLGNANTNTSVSLALPTSVRPGLCDLRRVGDHWETKLVAVPVGNDSADHDVDIPVLLDAGRLSTIAPSSFACATCSSVVVSLDSLSASASAPASATDSPSVPPPPSPPLIYADLPSEHWEELIDAWMCHTDQALSDQVAKHTAHGFWPTPEKVLVGGSYLLFAQELVVRENLKAVEDIRVCVSLFLFPLPLSFSFLFTQSG